MKRLVRNSILIVLLAAGRVGNAGAQTADAERWYAELAAAATLGHKSDSSFGGELGYTWTDERQLFFEIGRMGNVATSAMDDRAQVIAQAIGATFSTGQAATYFDGGLKYRLAPRGPWRPYVLLGIGAARVTSETNFAVNGVDVTNQLDQFGVQLGADLAGSVTKFFLTLGGGVNRSFGQRYLVDLSYRYGHIFASGAIEDDTGINTQRVQGGIGIRF
jgi:opacity protein-like surface antigen